NTTCAPSGESVGEDTRSMVARSRPSRPRSASARDGSAPVRSSSRQEVRSFIGLSGLGQVADGSRYGSRGLAPVVTTIGGPRAPPFPAPKPMSQPALLIIDMINTFDFEGGASLVRAAEFAARRIASLRRRWHQAGAPVVYVNDNFMRWQADFRELVAVCAHDDMRGAAIARLLQPGPDDYFVLKPKHSAFL